MEPHPPSSPSGATQTTPSWLQRVAGAWDRFWFKAADPTTLGLIRICTGLVVTYTMIVYTMDLQDLLGKNAWLDLETRDHWRWEAPVPRPMLEWREFVPPDPKNEEQKKYGEDYFRKHGRLPPDFPKGDTVEKRAQEALEIEEYINEFGEDPRLLRARGSPSWSIWFHVTDPNSMLAVQLGIVVVAFLFTIGFGTRLTAVLTWLAYLSCMHRGSMNLFGVDWMVAIVLLYLAIGPSGAALSVDRLLARWWATARVDVIGRWRAFWARRGTTPASVLPGKWSVLPTPSVGANVAIRLLQIHLCIIYLSAGLSKLQGQTWWTGEAVWGTIAVFEFAPMQSPLYIGFLRWLAANRVVFAVVMTTATLMTLAFEISYSYLIWRRTTRPLLLTFAFLFHGGIGLFMGLKTFSLLMMTMNLAFVPPETVRWVIRKLSRGRFGQEEMAPPTTPTLLPSEKVMPSKPEKSGKVLAGSGFKRKG